ncbi:hypothetical protein [Legionella oakridgensis]|uniref:Mitochondrial carrier protein n=2 Tax=Legionella oakridgensis TaxID=29423 RepID=W0BCA7_9GAMM|nr:hypothetical protein [Legionella oakridgensis]AHE66306.1 mitochondrial carrier protein [Legionella oakridgensis ATCC 33761 = DSM 21215]ETO93940.1 carrier protein [Legionella oakridgensis RV-2-2007]KTD37244.1 carrier protein [Legionella oakridgensis]STY16196.1 Mitochondrial carrier protein [Legionella longbeachae]
MSNEHDEKESLGERDSKLTYKQTFNIDVVSGLIAGASNSGLFNPWDRALYLSVKHNRPFLSIQNFKSPYQGFSQAVVQRAFLGGIYYIAQGELNTYLFPYLRHNLGVSQTVSQLYVGMIAGSIGGALTNGISAVKYHTWGQENASFRSSIREMWALGGFKPFLKGTTATMTRDMVFGSTYEMLRSFMNTTDKEDKTTGSTPSYLEFIHNASAAGVATVASSPFNYVRNMQYAMPPNLKPPSMYEALTHVWNESKNHQPSLLSRLSFFQRQFRIGWGTARVAVGMAVGQNLFDWTREHLREASSNSPETGLKK